MKDAWAILDRPGSLFVREGASSECLPSRTAPAHHRRPTFVPVDVDQPGPSRS